MTDIVKDVSYKITKTRTETSIRNNIGLDSLNENVLELMNDKCMIAPFLASSLLDLFKTEIKSQFELVKDSNSIRMSAFFINTSVPIILYKNMLTSIDTNQFFKLDVDFLKTIEEYDFSVSHSNPEDQELIYEFGEKNFDIKQKRRKILEIYLF